MPAVTGKRPNNKVISDAERRLACDFYTSSPTVVAKCVSSLKGRDRRELLGSSDILSRSVSFLEVERNRVSLAKLLVCLLPESLPIIQRALSQCPHRSAYELQFSLFCFLDDADAVYPENHNTLLSLVANYLLEVRAETAMAAWMAGELLGAHWNTCEAFRALTAGVLNGSYVAGREASIHGLEQLANRVRNDGGVPGIIEVLKTVVSRDRSDKVRRVATLAIEDLSLSSRRPRTN